MAKWVVRAICRAGIFEFAKIYRAAVTDVSPGLQPWVVQRTKFALKGRPNQSGAPPFGMRADEPTIALASYQGESTVRRDLHRSPFQGGSVGRTYLGLKR